MSEPEAKTPATPAAPAPETAAPETAAGGKKGKGKAKGPKKGFNEREKFVMKITGLVLAVMMIDLMVIRPVSNFLKRLDEMIATEESVIPKQLAILRHKDRIIADYEGISPFVTDPDVPQEEETARFLREIEQVSKANNLFVTNINTVKVSSKTDSIFELSVDIDGKGGIEDIRNFMASLILDNPAIRISGYSLKPQGKAADELKFQFSIVKIGVKRGGAQAGSA